MNLPPPADDYDQQNEAQTRRELVNEDMRNLKKNQNVDLRSAKLILTSANGTRYQVIVSNAGALSTVAL